MIKLRNIIDVINVENYFIRSKIWEDIKDKNIKDYYLNTKNKESFKKKDLLEQSNKLYLLVNTWINKMIENKYYFILIYKILFINNM